MDHASSEEIERCREYFKLSNMDVFEVIDKAIDVAAHDFPDQLRFLRYRIAQRLFSGTLKSSWNFEALAPPLEISDENSVISPVKDQNHHDASNPKDGGKFEERPRLVVRIKIKRSEEKDREAKGEATPDIKPKLKEQTKKRVKKASRQGEDAAKSGRKRKVRDDETVVQCGDGQQFLTRQKSSMLKITKIRFVHGLH